VLKYKDQKFWPSPFNVPHILFRLMRALLRARGLLETPPTAMKGFKVQLDMSEELHVQSREQEALKQCALAHARTRRKEEAVDSLAEVVAGMRDDNQTQLESLHSRIVALTGAVLDMKSRMPLPAGSRVRTDVQ